MIVNNTIINNGVDTSDATATAENIDSGYTAYVNGEKIEGRSTKNADTSGDTVTPDVLLSGYTAHDSYGNFIFGMCNPPSLFNASVGVVTSEIPFDRIETDIIDDSNMRITVHCLNEFSTDLPIVIHVSI